MHWNFNNIPAAERPQIKEAFEKGNFEFIIEKLEFYQVAPVDCLSCGFRASVHEWLNFILTQYKDWVNGGSIEY